MNQVALFDSKRPRLKMGPTQNGPLEVVSLFSGAGGLDLGLEAVGFSTIFATDIDQHSCVTLEMGREEAKRRNRPFLRDAMIVNADVSDLTGKKILKMIDRKPGQIALLSGGPPCQAFSVFGQRKGRSDPRGQLSLRYHKILAEIEPQAFLFENVYGLLSVEGGAVFADLCKALSNPKRGLRYTLSVHRINAADYGVPQNRDRVFIVGHRSGTEMHAMEPMFGPSAKARHRNVADALNGLPPIGSSFPENHVGRKHSQRIIDRYASMKPGERDRHTRINKLNLDKPSFTIIVGSDAGGGKGHIHPIEAREVTPRESARIQTFPDWWSFSGTSRHPIRQVGNAVPPLLGAFVGNEIRQQLFGLPKIKTMDFVELLDQSHIFEGE